MGRVGNRAEVTYSVTSLSRLRRRRGIGRRLPTGLAMAPTASPLFRAIRVAGGVFDEVAAAEAAADVGKFFEAMPFGVKPFWSITHARALANIRGTLDKLGVADAAGYRTHDLRRGQRDSPEEHFSYPGNFHQTGRAYGCGSRPIVDDT